MTQIPARDALRPREDVSRAFTPFEPLLGGMDEPCAVILGWRRRDATLRMLTATRAVIGGVTGVRPGDRLLLVLQRDQALVRDGRVIGMTLRGIEIEHSATGMPG